mgnify:CR=1 FL=1
MLNKQDEFDCKLQDIIDEIYRANELNRLGKQDLLKESKVFLKQQIKEIIEL